MLDSICTRLHRFGPFRTRILAVKQSMHRCTLDVSVEFPRTKGETGKSTVLGQTYTFTRRASAVLTSAVEKVGTKL